MKLGIRRIIALAFLIFSLLYIAFSFSLKEMRMIGDDRGWDPGSRALPLGLGFLMLALSIYLSYRESRKQHSPQPLEAGSRRLILLTVTLSVLYILLFEPIGFILTTSLLLYTLIYFNYEQDIRREMAVKFLAGFIFTLLLTLTVYTISRFVIRGLFSIGKSSGVEFLSSRLFSSFIALFLTAVLYMVLILSGRKMLGKPSTRAIVISVLTSAGVTEVLYLVFKQIFYVSLTQGIIIW
ncbi:MAG TPA: tripartite tricarboxylate transporter TctB family protein [Spirochaetia bacterium]|nr:tripartite tricarboxylate transporter TctB family protein [Spirochaetia bacterium]